MTKPRPKIRCTATVRGDRPCRNWALPATDPPRCNAHAGRSVLPVGPPPDDRRCTALNRRGQRCGGWRISGRRLCSFHVSTAVLPTWPAQRPCTATRRDGQPCRARALRGSDPPRCVFHAGRAGLAPGNRLAYRHGLFSRRFTPKEVASVRAYFEPIFASHTRPRDPSIETALLPILVYANRVAMLVIEADRAWEPVATTTLYYGVSRFFTAMRLYADYLKEIRPTNTNLRPEILTVRLLMRAVVITALKYPVPEPNFLRGVGVLVHGVRTSIRLRKTLVILPSHQDYLAALETNKIIAELDARGVFSPEDRAALGLE